MVCPKTREDSIKDLLHHDNAPQQSGLPVHGRSEQNVQRCLCLLTDSFRRAKDP